VKATAETIWSVPAYLPYLQPRLTDRAIASAEKKIGYPLPFELLNLLRRQNGGYIRFRLPDHVHDTIAGIGPNFPSLTDFDWDEVQEYVGFPLKGLVPFDGDGHWHLCLDYRKNPKSPSVASVDVECDSEGRVAKSFAAYLGMLRRKIDDEYVLEDVSDIESVKSLLASALGVSFAPPDADARGYGIHCARLGTERKPQRIWISPNTVPRGFVRRSEPGYERLKKLLPGTAERFPEAPAGSFLLSATEGVLPKVLTACAKSKIAVRPLSDYVE
jgi:hypothetical protein